MNENGVSVEINSVEKKFPSEIIALKKIDLKIPAGQFVTFLGPSGCGKSTLLRLIAKLVEPSSGAIVLSGGKKPQLGFVFQDAHLLPWKDVLGNVLLPLKIKGPVTDEDKTNAQKILSQVRIGEAAHFYPNQLSGGMKMRASIGRALITRPNLLLLDEPFASLDEIVRQDLADQLRQLWTELKMTVIFVTHSISESVYLSDRVVVLSPRPGTIIFDKKISLPSVREPSLRATPEFAQEVKSLFDILHKGRRDV